MHYISKKESISIKMNENERTKLNKKYINNQLIELKDYFDNLYNNIDSDIKLDKQQRIAILTDEDYNMIIAGAGSGKTTTMAAKVKYLVDIKKINPKDIVIISFTNKAVLELKQRINDDFNINCPIYTFHKFGLVLLNNKNIKVLDNGFKIVDDFLYNTIVCDNKLLYKLSSLFDNYFDIPLFNIFFKSLNDYCCFFKKKNMNICYEKFCLFCLQLIQQIKIRDLDFNMFYNLDNKYNIFIDFLKNLFDYYNNYLKVNNYLDFEDIINDSTNSLDRKKLNYKYIIVDEYQDISMQRFKLLKKVSDISNAKVIVVGDDFQAIYSFSGSDINLFTSFENMFGYCSELKITKTYRNSQQLIDVAGSFIMKNNKQIKKKLISSKSLNNCFEFIGYNNDEIKRLNHCLNDIINQFGSDQKILILGRYSFDINKYLGKWFKFQDGKLISIKYSFLNITYLTVHSSKGLGFDQVIIINCNNGVYGFPSKIINNHFINNRDEIDEERRLFYVALTRTKNKVYILYDKKRPSEFILEIKNIIKKQNNSA